MKNIWKLTAAAAATGLILSFGQSCGSDGSATISSTVPLSIQSDASSDLVTLYFDGNSATFTLADFAIALALFLDNNASVSEIQQVAREIFGLELTESQIIAVPMPGSSNPLGLFDLDQNGIPGQIEDFAIALALLLGETEVPRIEAIGQDILGIDLALPTDLPLPKMGATPFPINTVPPNPPPTMDPGLTFGAIVNTLEDQNGEDPTLCSLREAIIAANMEDDFGGCDSPAGSIEFDPALLGGRIVLTSPLPTITRDVRIVGSENLPSLGDVEINFQDLVSEIITIDGDEKYRVFDIANAEVEIVGVSILKGRIFAEDQMGLTSIPPSDIEQFSGAGIRNLGGSLTLNRVNVGSNIITDATDPLTDVLKGGFGGGIYSTGILNISESLVGLNAAILGPGIYSTGELLINSSVITSNSNAGGAFTGAVEINSPTFSPVTITNSLFELNATDRSVVIRNASQTTIIFEGNTSFDSLGSCPPLVFFEPANSAFC